LLKFEDLKIVLVNFIFSSLSFSVLYNWSLSVRYSALHSKSYNYLVLHCSFNQRERAHLKDPGVDGRIILSWIFRKWDGGHGLDSSGSRREK